MPGGLKGGWDIETTGHLPVPGLSSCLCTAAWPGLILQPMCIRESTLEGVRASPCSMMLVLDDVSGQTERQPTSSPGFHISQDPRYSHLLFSSPPEPIFSKREEMQSFETIWRLTVDISVTDNVTHIQEHAQDKLKNKMATTSAHNQGLPWNGLKPSSLTVVKIMGWDIHFPR